MAMPFGVVSLIDPQKQKIAHIHPAVNKGGRLS
jgi:hypothetical protein